MWSHFATTLKSGLINIVGVAQQEAIDATETKMLEN
jgi:hypothetical protein